MATPAHGENRVAPSRQSSLAQETIDQSQICPVCRGRIAELLRRQDGSYCPRCCQPVPESHGGHIQPHDGSPLVEDEDSIAGPDDDSIATSTASIFSNPPVFDDVTSDLDEYESIVPMTNDFASLQFHDAPSTLSMHNQPLTPFIGDDQGGTAQMPCSSAALQPHNQPHATSLGLDFDISSPIAASFASKHQTSLEPLCYPSPPPGIKAESTSAKSTSSRDAKRKSLSWTDEHDDWDQGVDGHNTRDTALDAGRRLSHGANIAKRFKSKKLNNRRFGCPFAKHDPKRYEIVYNACTAQPGMEWRWLLEHIIRVHSAQHRCIYCGQVWTNKSDWENELKRHMRSGSCVSVEERLCKPECMTSKQERLCRQENHDRLSPEEKWTALYMRLFPGEWPLPTPGYDFLVLRHRVQPEVKRSWPLPVAFSSPADGDADTQRNFDFNLPQITGASDDWTSVNVDASRD